jgi:hypothetical protein
MYYGFENGVTDWWIFPLIFFGMMVLCMVFMTRGMGCGFTRRDAQRRDTDAAASRDLPSQPPRRAGEER